MMKKLKLGLILLLVGCLLCVGLSTASATDVNSNPADDMYKEWLENHNIHVDEIVLDKNYSCDLEELNLDEEMESNNIESTNAMQATSSELNLKVDSTNDSDSDFKLNFSDFSVIPLLNLDLNHEGSFNDIVMDISYEVIDCSLRQRINMEFAENTASSMDILITGATSGAVTNDNSTSESTSDKGGALSNKGTVNFNSPEEIQLVNNESKDESTFIRLTTLRFVTTNMNFLRIVTANMNTVSDNVTFNDEPVIIITGEAHKKGIAKNRTSALVEEPVIITTITSSSAEDNTNNSDVVVDNADGNGGAITSESTSGNGGAIYNDNSYWDHIPI